MIYIFFKEILNSNFKKTGIVMKKMSSNYEIFLKNKWIKHKHKDKSRYLPHALSYF